MIIMQIKAGDKEITIPTWLWGAIGAGCLLAVGAFGTAGAWVGNTLFDHEQRITRNESKLSGIDSSISRIESGVERMNDKLDRIIERELNAVKSKPNGS